MSRGIDELRAEIERLNQQIAEKISAEKRLDKDAFTGRLAAARLATGLTKLDLSALTGINQGQLSHYEKGRQYPTVANLKLLCVSLDVSADYLLGLREDES